MSRSPEQKIRLLVLYDILKSESDEERPLSTNELIEKLAEYGITATRQTIIFFSAMFVLRKYRTNPIFVMLGSGVLGAVFYLLL